MGYKVHLTETFDTPTEAGVRPAPNLITDVFTTDATVLYVKATAPVLQRFAERGLMPGEHCLDCGYPSAGLIAAALGQGIHMVTPVLQTARARPRPPPASTRALSPSTGRPARSVAPPAGATRTGTQ
ncbi:hypothetical protein ACFYW6_38020 [Streptomyces sp. NPDC002659]|uniref:hypothetical protein n=1 Tax=Streptomyces sp. NPDC002659 TaxID=3364656 RepID=UPI0036BA6177